MPVTVPGHRPLDVTSSVAALGPDRFDDVLDVLCDAFRDYPVMRYVLGPAPEYRRRLRTLVGLFVAARFLRGDLLLGLPDEAGRLVGAALVTLPGDRPPPAALEARREAVWAELGAAERSRYEAFGAACARFTLDVPHHHLNMIGVRASLAGRGLGRTLLEQVHGLADADPGSHGLTLSTETARNVGLYEHFGYRLLGRARVSPELETWAFHRPRAAGKRA